MTDMASIGVGVSIRTVERETGISQDTLRIWERRYGFPQPGRAAISFAGNYPVKLIGEGLSNPRRELPSNVEIWAGGSAIARSKRSMNHITLLPTLNRAIKEVSLWRQCHHANKGRAF